jgi:hypothetical protein
MRYVVLVAALALACGAPQRAAKKPPAPTYAVKRYAPLEIKADAKAPGQAVILGTDERDGSTVLPLATPAIDAAAPAAGDAGIVDLVVATLLAKDVDDLPAHSGTRGASARDAVELLAILTGATIDRKAVVDGTLLPDGTIAASASVTDLHAAYARATGTELPATLPVAASEMALDAATVEVLKAKYKQWQAKLAVQWGEILQLESAGRIPATLALLRDRAKRLAETAESLRRQNQHAAAYARILDAVAHATSANQIYDVLTRVQANQLDAALAAFDAAGVRSGATQATFDAIAAITPATISGHLRSIAAFRAAHRATALVDLAVRSHASARTYVQSLAGTRAATLGGDPIAEHVVAQVAPAMLYATKIAIDSALATEHLELAGGSDVAYSAPPAALWRVARRIRDATAASTSSFDGRVIEPFAARAKVSIDEARRRAALLEVDYAIATSDGSEPPSEAPGRSDESPTDGLSAIAGAELAYLHAAKLVATFDVLGVAIDAPRPLARVANARKLDAMIAAAERHARAAARAARVATGAIPVQAKLSYQLARAGRRGTASDKLDALGQLWTSTLASQTAVMLARN